MTRAVWRSSYRSRSSRTTTADLPSASQMNVRRDEAGILTATQAHPDVCEEVWWGKRLAAVRVDLRIVAPALLAELLADAWEHKASARLRRARPR